MRSRVVRTCAGTCGPRAERSGWRRTGAGWSAASGAARSHWPASSTGFFAAAYSWAAGDDLGDVIADEEMSGGDFVRNVKQVIDLLGQIRAVATQPGTAEAAGEAADRLFRGVVAASSTVGPGGRPEEPVGPGGRPEEPVGPGGRPEEPVGPGGRP